VAPTTETLIAQYQALVRGLLVRRALEGPLPQREEALRTQECADFLAQIPEDRYEELEMWVEEIKNQVLGSHDVNA
jgi:hypothetical protein